MGFLAAVLQAATGKESLHRQIASPVSRSCSTSIDVLRPLLVAAENFPNYFNSSRTSVKERAHRSRSVRFGFIVRFFPEARSACLMASLATSPDDLS